METKKVLYNNNGNLSINLYVRPETLTSETIEVDFSTGYSNWLQSSENLRHSMNQLFENK